MGKRALRVAFSPGVVFDDKRTKLRKHSLAKMMAQPKVCEASPEQLEAMTQVHDATWGRRIVSKKEKEREDACRLAIRLIVDAKRSGLWPAVAVPGPTPKWAPAWAPAWALQCTAKG